MSLFLNLCKLNGLDQGQLLIFDLEILPFRVSMLPDRDVYFKMMTSMLWAEFN